jgi:transposase
MSKSNFSEDFKRDAVRQFKERGYPVSQRHGVSQHSLYEWKKKIAASNAKGNDKDKKIRRLMKSCQTTDAVSQALRMAVWRRKPKEKGTDPLRSGLAVHQHGLGIVPEPPQSGSFHEPTRHLP